MGDVTLPSGEKPKTKGMFKLVDLQTKNAVGKGEGEGEGSTCLKPECMKNTVSMLDWQWFLFNECLSIQPCIITAFTSHFEIK